jgi:hypothetical protein
MLSSNHIRDVCMGDSISHNTCRYLIQDENDYTKYYCSKLNARGKEIDEELNNFMREAIKRGKDPQKENIPLGDNCKGYPLLKHLPQGYDVKKPKN